MAAHTHGGQGFLVRVFYQMVAIWRATADEDGHYVFAVAL
jgi:hypothetical protein